MNNNCSIFINYFAIALDNTLLRRGTALYVKSINYLLQFSLFNKFHNYYINFGSQSPFD